MDNGDQGACGGDANKVLTLPALLESDLFRVPHITPLSTQLCPNRNCYLPKERYQCSACFSVAYCSEKHQLEDWDEHKKTCNTMIKRQTQTPTSSEFGPYQANRKLDTDTVVLNLSPIMIGPSTSLSSRSPNKHLCISCNAWYPSRGAFACRTCGWSVCSHYCSMNPIHASNECKIFRDAGVKPRSGVVYLNGILALRCLLLQKTDPEALNKLWDSRGKCARMTRSSKAAYEDGILVRFLLDDCKLQSSSLSLTHIKLDREHILLFLKVVEACTLSMPESHEIRRAQRVSRYISAKYVFPEKLNITRHCSPNMRWEITYHEDLKETFITFRTTLTVPPNEFLTATWGNEVEMGTLFRQSSLTARFTEPCKCSRCLDPSENQTEFNTVRCSICKNVSLRPLDPTDRKSNWKCSIKQCKNFWKEMPALPILHRLRGVYDDLNQLLSVDGKYLANLLKFIEDYTDHDRLIHPKHFLAIQAVNLFVRNIASKIGEAKHPAELDFTLLTTCEKLIERCLEIYPALVPGKTEIVGRLLYQKQAVMSFKLLRDAERFVTIKGVNYSRIPSLLVPIRDTQQEAYQALKFCSAGTNSHAYAMNLKNVLTELRELFLYRCNEMDPLDRTLAAQIFNMYAIMSNVARMIVPDPPWDGWTTFKKGDIVVFAG